MKKLNSYIVKQLLIGFLLVTFTLMSIIWLTQSLRFVDLITNKGLPLSTFALMTSLLMPRIFAILSSICLFAAVLFVYNRMLSDRELVVMKAAGISPWQNSKPVLIFGVLLGIFNFYVLNNGIPQAEKFFDEVEWQIKNNVSHLMFREGEFTTLQNGLTVFISSHEEDGSVAGILINDERNPKLKSTVSAEMGRIVYTQKGPKLIMVNGVRQEINNQNSQFSSLSFDRYSVDFGLPKPSKKRDAGVRQQSLEELLSARSNNNLSKKEQKRYFVEGNKRLITPLLNVVMGLLGCTGLLVGSFNRRGQAKIIFLSITSMVSIQALDLILTNIAAKHLDLLFLVYLNTLLPMFACLYLLLFYNPAFFMRKKNKEVVYE